MSLVACRRHRRRSWEQGAPVRGRATESHAFLLRFWLIVSAVLLANWPTQLVHSQELKFPQIIKIRYEALNPRVGGQFIIWVEREKIWYGLDSKIFPAARSVDVTYVTPAPGGTTITFIAVTGVNSTTPDYFHLSGNIRFKVSGMKIAASNLP
ncbi:MAG: hypothetical protein WBF58_23380 [Xanthobacteraceae bacterium]